MKYDSLETERLLLRPWTDADRAPHAAMNADPRVMEFFPATRTREESDASIEKYVAHFEEHGFGFWVAESRADGAFVGIIGLNLMKIDVPFAPALEVGWRLPFERWGGGLATEGARACVEYAFARRGYDEVVAVTAVQNARSRRVMEKLGMTTDPSEDFEHPSVPEGSRVRLHVLYRLRRGA